MPTTRPRHTLTETDALSAAIADARKRWPDASPSALLSHLVEAGHDALRAQLEERVEERRKSIDSTAGTLSGAYDTNYLDELRSEWPR